MLIKQSLFQNEFSLELLFNIFFNPTKSVYDHSIDLNYSESHLRKTIMKLNEFIASVGAKIEYQKYGTESRPVISTDQEIRLNHFITQLYLIGKFDDIYPLREVNQLSVFESFIAQLNLPITEPMVPYLKTLAKVTDARYKQGFNTRENSLQEYQNIYQEYKVSDFSSIFHISTNNEIRSYFGRPFLEQHQADLKAVNDIIITMLLRIIIAGPNVDDVLNRYNIFYELFKIEQPGASRMFSETLSKYSSLIGKDFEDYYGEIVYNLYIHIPNLRVLLNYSFGVYSDLGVTHAFTVTRFIRRYFPAHRVEVYDKSKEYDFILSTIKQTPEMEDFDPILVSDLPSSKDIQEIYHAIYEKYNEEF